MTFYLFRHGETYFSKHKAPYGDQVESAEILPESSDLVLKIAEKLKNENVPVIYSSTIKRCVQTVEIIKKQIPEVNIFFDKRIEEEKIHRSLESFDDLNKRIGLFVEDIKKSNFEKVAICSHGWPLAVMIAILKKGTATESDLSFYPPCGEIMELKN